MTPVEEEEVEERGGVGLEMAAAVVEQYAVVVVVDVTVVVDADGAARSVAVVARELRETGMM